jgi:hypothetical protein
MLDYASEEDILRIKNLQAKFNRIEDKNKCLRVQFLDWLSDKLADYSIKIKNVSDSIDAPCFIKFDKPAEHLSVFEEIEQAAYFYDPSMHTYTDIKGLKAGKSLEECTYVMYKDGSLKSQAQSKKEWDERANERAKVMDEEISKLKKAFEELL